MKCLTTSKCLTEPAALCRVKCLYCHCVAVTGQIVCNFVTTTADYFQHRSSSESSLHLFRLCVCMGHSALSVGKKRIHLLSGWLASRRQRPVVVICHVGCREQLKNDGGVIVMIEKLIMKSYILNQCVLDEEKVTGQLCVLFCVPAASSASLAQHAAVVRWVNGWLSSQSLWCVRLNVNFWIFHVPFFFCLAR